MRWRLIREEYSLEIGYIPGKKNIVSDALSRLAINGNQDTTHESMYTMETMSELYNTKELSEGKFPLPFNLIYFYHQEDPFLMEKTKCKKQQKGSFCRGRNTIELVTYKNK